MQEAIRTTVIEFPRVQTSAAASRIYVADIEAEEGISPENFRSRWRKRCTSPRVSPRTNFLHLAYASNLSDSAFRVLFGLLSFGDGSLGDVYPANSSIEKLTNKSPATVKRAFSELEKSGWMSSGKRGTKSAVRRFSLPVDVALEIATEVLASLEGSKMSFPGLDSSKMSHPAPLDSSKMSGVTTAHTQPEIGRKLKNEPSNELDGSNLSPNPYKKEKKEERKEGGEEESQRLNRSVQPSTPAQTPMEGISGNGGGIAAAAAVVAKAVAATPAAKPAAPVVAPEQSCWNTPRAKQLAFVNGYEAQAQRQVQITPTGRIVASGAFLGELEAEFPLVEVTAGLAAAEVNVQADRGAIACMQQVRRQFGYMQQDAARRKKAAEDREVKQKADDAAPQKHHPVYGTWNEVAKCYFK